MFCKECGNELAGDAVFCNKCGAKVVSDSTIGMSSMTTVPGNVENTSVKKKRKWLPFVLLFSTLIIGILTLLIIVYVKSNSPERRLQEQLDLGYRYLSELDYERAVVAYEAAIDIDPSNVEAYQGLIDAYAGIGDTDGILKAYELASDNLGRNDLKEIRETVADVFVYAIDKAVSEGDFDIARELVDDLSNVDSKIAEKTLLDVLGNQNTDESDDDGEEDVVDEVIVDEGMELINSGNYTEALAYYAGLIDQNPTDTDPYIACAAVYLAMDDSLSALQILENGIVFGADSQLLLSVEDYIREKTIPLSCTGTHREPEGVVNSEASGWSLTTFDEQGNKAVFEKHMDNGSEEYIEYDSAGNETYTESVSWYGHVYYWRTFNTYNDVTYSKYESISTSALEGDEISETYFSYEYDSLGRKISRETRSNGNLTAITYYEYDDYGNMVHLAYVSMDGSSPIERFYEYDSLGRNISWSETGIYLPDYGKYSYDDSGNMIHEEDLEHTADNLFDLMNNVVYSEGYRDYTPFVDEYEYTYHFIGDVNSVLEYY